LSFLATYADERRAELAYLSFISVMIEKWGQTSERNIKFIPSHSVFNLLAYLFTYYVELFIIRLLTF
jgi:hypothetical protein